MQYARYKDGLSKLMTDGYGKAKEYLQNVIRQFPSAEVMKTLEKIKKMEAEMKELHKVSEKADLLCFCAMRSFNEVCIVPL